jgi:hypothetical protein
MSGKKEKVKKIRSSSVVATPPEESQEQVKPLKKKEKKKETAESVSGVGKESAPPKKKPVKESAALDVDIGELEITKKKATKKKQTRSGSFSAGDAASDPSGKKKTKTRSSSLTVKSPKKPPTKAPTKLRICGYAPYTGRGGSTDNVIACLTNFKTNFDLVMAELKVNLTFKKDRDFDDDLLKIFIAPEWAFRKPNALISPPQKKSSIFSKKKPEPAPKDTIMFWTASELAVIIKGLLEISNDHPELLIVPGSILWAIPGGIQFAKSGALEESKALVYNTCPIVVGGKVIHFCHKQMEGLDANTSDGQVFVLDDNQGLPELAQKLKTSSVDIGSGVKGCVSNFFTHRKLKFGIEICADHNNEVLKKQHGTECVDVQLLVSCGACIRHQGIAARKGGVVINCDGSMTNADAMKKTCCGLVRVDKDDATKFVPDPRKKAEVYKTEGKTFPGSFPNLSFVVDEIVELE